MLTGSGNPIQEERLEDYLVRGLIDFDDIDYEEHADLLYKLSAQVVEHGSGRTCPTRRRSTTSSSTTSTPWSS